MEFNKKLQELRKSKGLTQEELSKILFVSRTAVSKWESGRGYPNLDSLKEISKFFGLSVDELLSGNELLNVAIQDGKSRRDGLVNLFFGLIDLSFILFLFLPFFAQRLGGNIFEVSLIALTKISVWLKITYMVLVIAMICCGALTLTFEYFFKRDFSKITRLASLIINVCVVILFMISLQTYPSVFSFTYLLIKALIVIKGQRY